MGKVFLSILLVLLAAAIVSFVSGFHSAGYIFGFMFGTFAMGISFVYSARDDDRYRPNYLNNGGGKK
ncbi:hypothetical protein LCM00_02840 [Bacillus infantis]|uniref:hypothetical protein n=1 Tax=Bacillus TaxID=1386 RepID=UPI000C7783C6|nr:MULTISPECIES: hypothetical protein [Bacillus]MCA1038435.1 hypothetical protein [Bacillus infantis]MCR6611242.1 hypothetical protein [Bacillus infantis]PLR74813.1 hypothetical protein CYJ37_04115 [Bacillus sp. UMB0728]